MSSAVRARTVVCLAILFVTPAVVGELRQDSTLEPNEEVSTVEFTLRIGSDGEALDEPIALDLGLGFPFWLRPLGASTEEVLPVGAIPQESSIQASLQPGESAKFVFRREGDAGQDTLRSTPMLLDGVQVADIARLGLASRGQSNWELAGYELRINGKLLAANDAVGRNPKDAIEQAQTDLDKVRDDLAPQLSERKELEALESASLLFDEEATRLDELKKQTRESERRMAQLAGIPLSLYPWFLESGLKIPGRPEGAQIETARVRLVTADHTNAETYNYVYVRIGGHKYFLYPPQNLFQPLDEPQSFELPLLAGPLAANDVRNIGLGMLAHDRPYSTAPDRWHPQRLVVELDQRVTYDSVAEPFDQRSLDTIRIIPPAHFDEAGQLRVNEPNPRECLVWISGRGQGLDLDRGEPIAMGTSAMVPVEPGGVVVAGNGDGGDTPGGGSGFGDDGYPAASGADDPIGDWPDDPSGVPGEDDGWWAGSDPGMGAGATGELPLPAAVGSDALAELLQRLTELVDLVMQILGQSGLNAPPTGTLPQINGVNIVRSESDPTSFQVLWGVSGNEEMIDYYQVSLWQVKPELDSFLIAHLAEWDRVPAGTHATPGFLSVAGVDDPSAWIQPMVVGVLRNTDGLAAPSTEPSPALPWLPPNATVAGQPVARGQFYVDSTTSTPVGYAFPLATRANDAVAIDNPAQPLAWLETYVTTPRALTLAEDGLTDNVVLRDPPAAVGDLTVVYGVDQALDASIKYRLFGTATFLNGPAAAPEDLEVTAVLHRKGRPFSDSPADRQDITLNVQVPQDAPATVFELSIDPTVFAEGIEPISIKIRCKGGNNAEVAPVAICGLRLVPQTN